MAKRASDRWLVKPGKDAVDLSAIDPRSQAGAPGGKAETRATFERFSTRLWGLQERLWAERRRSVLVVLQAIDAGGKDGTAKHLSRGLNPAGSRVVAFRAPSEEARAHDFLWRVHPHVPAKGEVVLFNRSHYEDVLVVRVKELVSEDVWRPRFGLIRDFEALLAESGTAVVKIFLHISKEEQAERMRDRIADPDKWWKFNRADLEDRARWEDFQVAFGEAVGRTSTADAPWYVVPADRKWYRNWAVSNILVDTLERLDPRYPVADDLSDVVIV